MDINSRNKISDLIKEATNTGSLTLSTEHVQQIKSLLKVSNTNVKSAFDLLMDRLKTKHSQVRISTLNIINEIFMRSKYFRELVCNVLSILFELTLGLNLNNPLPPPADSSRVLKSKALEFIEKWYEAYGPHYNLLKNAYNYLKNSLKLDFPDIRNQASQRDREEQERKEKTQSLLRLKYTKLTDEFDEITTNINSIITVMEETFKTVIPDPSTNFDNLFGSDDEDYNNNNNENNQSQDNDNEQDELPDILRSGGFGSTNYSITVTLDNEKEADSDQGFDKEKILLLQDNLTELERIQNLIINDWYNTLIKININPVADTEYSNYLRKVVDTQTKINNVKGRCKDIGVEPFQHSKDMNNNNVNGSLDEIRESEELLEGVEFEDANTLTFSTTTTTTTTTTTSYDQEQEDQDGEKKIYRPYFKRDFEHNPDDVPEEERIEDLLKRAPVVPANPTLFYWGEKEIEIGSGVQREHRFLGESDAPTISMSAFQSLNQMTAIYTPPPRKPSKPCNFPLKNGGLCPRKDFEICPFHGKIIDRDENGNPLNGGGDDNDENNVSIEQQSNSENGETTPPLYNPNAFKETPKKRKVNPNLTDISEKDTTKFKLEKILSKKR
ncbi:hypothetical protein CYY_000356 [Polysphondylium violaceum]|uniref:VHS domain-containing protein n=1 Tax=Polysphondylium violaceum TaxID=133409 RepID=A0A8J4Q4W9_9MYCE|nr:hypothetical protein CYY_000356 [Polysphondylium violaceum]